jgi:hypothetical protein
LFGENSACPNPEVETENIMKTENEKILLPSKVFFAFLCGILVIPFIFSKINHPKGTPSAGVADTPESDPTPAQFVPRAFIDLGNYSNAGLKTNWLGGEMENRTLADLPTNVNVFHGLTFRVEGLIQLQGITLKERAPWYPESVKGIPIQMMCSNLYFFHGTAWSVADGSKIGAYVIHFEDGGQVEFPIVYGTDVRNWSFNEKDPYQTTNTVWSSKHHPIFFRLYASTWRNPKDDVKVTSVDFVSLETECAPFLLAITAQ